jgi:hypothetical protein
MEAASEDELRRALRDLYWRWKDEYGYNANRFVQKLQKDGAVKTAGDLVSTEGESKGFQELHARNLLELTVEALVLRAEFRGLFPLRVLEAAEKKLRAAGATFLDRTDAS